MVLWFFSGIPVSMKSQSPLLKYERWSYVDHSFRTADVASKKCFP